MIIVIPPDELPKARIIIDSPKERRPPHCGIEMMLPSGRSDETHVLITVWAQDINALEVFIRQILVEIEKVQEAAP